MANFVYVSRTKNGFTLIELLVVIAIIGILSSIVLTSLNSSRIRANNTKAKQDLRNLYVSLQFLVDDVNKWPNGCPPDANDSAETLLSSQWGGLITAPTTGFDSTYSTNPGGCGWTLQDIARWKGPYATGVIDPWGRSYFFDPDFTLADLTTVAVLESFGPNGVQNYYNGTSDDIIYIMP
jgi:prepilin-type N-terminal cleavage/methylation domain-containing protein